jgi:aspartate 1-decarboxylase
LGKAGDLLVVMTFAEVTPEEAKSWKPKTVTLAERNQRIVRLDNPEVPSSLLSTFHQ